MNYKILQVDIIEYQEEYNRFQALQDKPDFKKKIEELAMSINKLGLINPISVEEIEKGKYKVVAGNRRLQAVKEILKNKDIEVFVFPHNPAITLAENIQREELTQIEKGEWINRYVESLEKTGVKKETIFNDLAKQTGKAPRTLYDYAKVAKDASPKEKADVKTKSISATSVSKSKRKSGTKKMSKGQTVKSTGKAFITLTGKITEKLQYIAKNSAEYKENKEVIANFKRLQKAVAVVEKYLA